MHGSPSTFLTATAQTAKSVDEIANSTRHADADTLVIFDVDYVLTQPSEPALQMFNIKRYSSSFGQILLSLTPVQRDVAAVMIVSKVPNELIDEQILDVLRELQTKGAKTIALTAILTGSIGEISSISQWRVRELANLGIDFSSSYADLPAFIFEECPSYQNRQPEYRDGIIFSNGEHGNVTKGEALVRFLRRTEWIPKKIIFVDDRLENVINVQEFLTREFPQVEFVGVHYVGAALAQGKDLDGETFRERIGQLIGEVALG